MKTWSLLATVSLLSAEDNQAEYRKEQNLNHTVFPPKDTKGLILQGSESFICQMEWKVWMLRKHHPEGLAAVLPVVSISVENSIILNGTVMVNPPCLLSSSSSDQSRGGDWVHYKLCICAFSFLQSTSNRLQHGCPGLRQPLKKHSLDDLSPDLSLIFSFKELMWPMIVEFGITCNYFNWGAPLYLLCTFRI